jgi:hypothetical protein
VRAWTGAAVAAGILGALWIVWGETRGPGEPVDRGPSGIDFVIPSGYDVLDLGETTVERAAVRLLAAVADGERSAVRFTRSEDRIQILVDPAGDTLEEHLVSRHGTVRRTIWREGVTQRLRWAGEHGDFEAPGLPPAQSRNPYH